MVETCIPASLSSTKLCLLPVNVFPKPKSQNNKIYLIKTRWKWYEKKKKQYKEVYSCNNIHIVKNSQWLATILPQVNVFFFSFYSFHFFLIYSYTNIHTHKRQLQEMAGRKLLILCVKPQSLLSAMVWMFASAWAQPQFLCWNLTPKVVVLGDGAFGRWLNPRDRTLMNGISTFRKEPGSASFPFPHNIWGYL